MSANPMAMAPTVATHSLSSLARRIAREMRIAASLADDCQDLFGDDEMLDIQPETAIRLQGLDLLSQQLIELGKLFDRLAAGDLDGQVPSTILDDVCLSDLKRRLAGQSAGVRVLDPEVW